jgi:hypothetical protein
MGKKGRVESPLDVVAGAGQFEIVKWIGDSFGGFFSIKATVLAAANGHLNVVKFSSWSTRTCTRAAMDGSAKNGHLKSVTWLHENRSEGCTTAAMDGAARNGCLDVVKWLHENRTEGCTPRAMDRAAGNGHLHVVQWFHENRHEGCTYSAVDLASNGGHLEVLKGLQRHRNMEASYQPMDNALDLAASNDHVETFR